MTIETVKALFFVVLVSVDVTLPQKKKRKIGDDEEDDEDGGNNDDDEEVITEEHLQYVDARNPAAHQRTVTAETYQSSLLWWHKVDNIAEYDKIGYG